MNRNPYLPDLATVVDVRQETGGDRSVRTLTVEFDDKEVASSFAYKPGQLAMLSVFGKGESMISITSSPTMGKALQFSVMRMGRVTSILHYLNKGEKIGVRGPYGNGFPVGEWKGKNLIFIGGGIGSAPLRSAYSYALHNRKDYADISIIYGARTSSDIVFRDELRAIAESGGAKVEMSIDKPESDWDGFVGFAAMNVKRLAPKPDNAIVITCGPVMLIKTVIKELMDLHFKPSEIYTTLENKMKCGVGKCGRCNIGPVLVCKNGPVFTVEQIRQLPSDL